MTNPIPRAALDDRLFFGGTSGSGKTYGAGTAVELLLASSARVVIPDPLGVWWGLALNPDGKSSSAFRTKEKLVIFGGPHGDVPITENSGKLIGETVAGMAESCILDLSELKTGAAERRFMLAFLGALYTHKTREPMHLVFDEADLWAPQRILDREGEAMKLLGMMENICRRGRVKGFIPWLISQRPAVISKNVLSQIDGMIAFKLTSVQDRDAIGDWVQGQADKKEWDSIWSKMPTLELGEGLVWLPARGVFKVAQFPKKATFDSSRAPKRGERRASAPTLKPVNLEKLQARLQSVEAEARASDPKALKADVARLQQEKAALERQMAAAADTEPVADESALEAATKRGFERARAEAVKNAKAQLADALAAILADTDQMTASVKGAIDVFRLATAERLKTVARDKEALKPVYAPAPAAVPRAMPTLAPRSPSRATQAAPQGDGTLAKGERIVLTAIAQHANGCTREQLTVITGYKRSSRDTYIQRLGAAGMVENRGDRIVATDAGVSALGANFEPLPTGAALRDHMLAQLPQGERRVLEVLIAGWPNPVPRDTIAEATGYQRSSRDTYLQRLSARELVDSTGPGAVKASDLLFETYERAA